MSVPSVGDPAPVVCSAMAAAGSPPAGTIATCSPAPPGEWNVTVRSRPTATSRRSTATSTGGTPGVTAKVETTARWSEGQGVTDTLTSGLPFSPTMRLAVAVAAPAA